MTEQNFDRWLQQVNRHVESMCGLSIHDLPDIPYSDLHEAEEEPLDVALIVLEDAGLNLEEEGEENE